MVYVVQCPLEIAKNGKVADVESLQNAKSFVHGTEMQKRATRNTRIIVHPKGAPSTLVTEQNRCPLQAIVSVHIEVCQVENSAEREAAEQTVLVRYSCKKADAGIDTGSSNENEF